MGVRVYRDVDPDTGRQRYATRTVHGSRRVVLQALEALVAEVDNAATHEGTLAELLERCSAASAEWEPSTQATVRWATTCHLVPHLGDLPVAKQTAVDIDDFYACLLRRGGPKGCGLEWTRSATPARRCPARGATVTDPHRLVALVLKR
ncbi:MAG: hypothetical protein KY469_21360 [Actinobacteria bacterium]|nr:hypothetical protein [Actinomycetota bacterium]